jgi:hypothetical protein
MYSLITDRGFLEETHYGIGLGCQGKLSRDAQRFEDEVQWTLRSSLMLSGGSISMVRDVSSTAGVLAGRKGLTR